MLCLLTSSRGRPLLFPHMCLSQICKLAFWSLVKPERPKPWEQIPPPAKRTLSPRFSVYICDCWGFDVCIEIGAIVTNYTHTHTTSLGRILLNVCPNIDARREARRRIGFPLCLDQSVHKFQSPVESIWFFSILPTAALDRLRGALKTYVPAQRKPTAKGTVRASAR